MKKIATFLIIIIALSGLNIFSQTIQNTTWLAYYSSGAFFNYFYFGIDTAYISSDNVTYTAFIAYQESDNNFSMVDLPDGDCSVVDTGKYTLLLQNDTLRLILVKDNCTLRAETATTLYLVKVPTGIQNTSFFNDIKLYPNPAEDRIIFEIDNTGERETVIELVTVTGTVIYRSEYRSSQDHFTGQIDVSGYARGMYFVRIWQGGAVYNGKIVLGR